MMTRSSVPASLRLAVVAVATVLTACGGTEPGDDPPETRVAFLAVPCLDLDGNCHSGLLPGETHQLTAIAFDPAGNPIDDAVLTWSSSDPSVLGVTPTGAITALAPGLADAIVTSDTANSRLVFVVLEPVGSVTLAPAVNGIVPGGSYSLLLTLRDGSGNELPWREPTWRTSDPAVAEVDAGGLITGKAPGIATITATREGQSGGATIEVRRLTFTAIASNRAHSCGLTAVGEAWCWGLDQDGQLGYGLLAFGQTPYGSTPRRVAGSHTFVAISPGAHHTCALDAGGAAWCWGSNAFGQLGTAAVEFSTVPVAVSGGRTFATISGGNAYTCALTASGEAWCWGRNHVGQLGTGDASDRVDPTPVLTSLRFSWIGGKRDDGHVGVTCAIALDGKAYCWGSNQSGALGDGGVVDLSAIPREVTGGLTFTQLSTMGYRSCGVTGGGEAYCWGAAADGLTAVPAPTPVPGGRLWTAMTVGPEHVCGLAEAGAAYCWGLNGHGQFGNGTASGNLTLEPVPAGLGLSFTSLTSGDAYTCGTASDGRVYCWGEGNDGSLGTGDPNTRLVPTVVAGQP
jgi:alpha-tubulin suppressor-like RCC1 family protein